MKIIALSLLSTLIGLFTGAPRAAAFPAQIVLLRHAEKPSQGPELSVDGWTRAQALPQTLASHPELQTLGAPAALYAMSPSRPGRSVRSIQTLTPLARATGLQIETRYRGRDSKRMVQDVLNNPKNDGKQVVICWRREEIPKILELFGVPGVEDVRSNQYDLLWVLTADKSQSYSLSIMHQP